MSTLEFASWQSLCKRRDELEVQLREASAEDKHAARMAGHDTLEYTVSGGAFKQVMKMARRLCRDGLSNADSISVTPSASDIRDGAKPWPKTVVIKLVAEQAQLPDYCLSVDELVQRVRVQRAEAEDANMQQEAVGLSVSPYDRFRTDPASGHMQEMEDYNDESLNKPRGNFVPNLDEILKNL